ncbi:unnamed protein product [Phaedon cochleariae]|uniref:3'-5' exonuclease domain-containing protein n=1 Tax=Phaedon cochleariae TaxID=80249 RepID=A0A9P0DPN9_PHACE|nr:unnamed protein product [Phaedon cochleariae]
MEDEIPYNELYKVGDHLILKLCCNDIFEGDFSAGGKNRIDLINTKQHNNPNKLGGILSFYRNEIDNIHQLKTKMTIKPEEPIENDIQDLKKINMVEEEYERLKEMARSYVYLENADNRYYEAVKSLGDAELIGVVALGMEDSRTAVIKLLVICNFKQVYIFDMTNMKNRSFYQELKEILESEYTCKVVHGGGPLIDILYRNYKVYMKYVFDTQVVDLIIEKNKKRKMLSQMRDISECLVEYLNFPSSLLKNALDVTIKQWAHRPLSDRKKLYASQLVTYLITLKEDMQKILFSEMYKAIENVHDHYYYMNCYDFSKKMRDNSVSEDIEKLIPMLNKSSLDTETENVGSVSSSGTNVQKM